MHLRQDNGEIAPATWLAGAVASVTLGGVIVLAERQIGTTPAFVVFWLGCTLAVLCLFGAVRQHFINVGRDRGLSNLGISPEPSKVFRSATTVKALAQVNPEGAQGLQPERHYVSDSAVNIVGFFKSHTTIQGLKLVEPYIGKWMELSGTIADVSKNTVVLKGQEESGWISAVLSFDDAWFERLSMLRLDQPVRAAGQIENVNAAAIALKHCELLG